MNLYLSTSDKVIAEKYIVHSFFSNLYIIRLGESLFEYLGKNNSGKTIQFIHFLGICIELEMVNLYLSTLDKIIL